MNKYRWLLALVVLVLASLACQTVMGGGPQVPDVPQVPQQSPNGDDSGPAPTQAPSDNGGSTDGGSQTIGGFPVPGDATNVVQAQDTVVFETKMSTDDLIKFYRDEYGKLGLKERTSMTVTMGQLFTIVFDGDSSGKAISISGADSGKGTTVVTITKQAF